jgi:hypothetical protein
MLRSAILAGLATLVNIHAHPVVDTGDTRLANAAQMTPAASVVKRAYGPGAAICEYIENWCYNVRPSPFARG